jgi:hypothetical protein
MKGPRGTKNENTHDVNEKPHHHRPRENTRLKKGKGKE